MSSTFPLSIARRNIFTQHLARQTHIDQAVAKHLRTLERPDAAEAKVMTSHLEDTRLKYKDIGRKFIIDRGYPQEDIDEEHLALEVELYLFVALGQPKDYPNSDCDINDNF